MMATDQELHGGYRVDTVIEGAVEQVEYYAEYKDALDYAEEQAEHLRNNPNVPDWQVTIYDEAPYPPELTDEWTA